MSTTVSLDVILYEFMGGGWTPWTGYIISSLAFDSCTLERLKGSERRLSLGGFSAFVLHPWQALKIPCLRFGSLTVIWIMFNLI